MSTLVKIAKDMIMRIPHVQNYHKKLDKLKFERLTMPKEYPQNN